MLQQDKHLIAVEVENKPGILTRISSLFSRRGFKLESLAVAHTHKPGISRITLEVKGDSKILEQIRKQSQKLIHVLTAKHLPLEKNSVIREIAILKILYNSEIKTETHQIDHLVDFYSAKMLGFTENTLIVEVTGSSEKIDSFYEELLKIKKEIILEMMRSGKVGLEKGMIKNGKNKQG